MVDMAKLVNAQDCDSCYREFEPHYPPHKFLGLSS